MSEGTSGAVRKRKPLRECEENAPKRVKTQRDIAETGKSSEPSSKKLIPKAFAAESFSFGATGDEIQCSWTIPDLLAELESLRPTVAQNIVELLQQDNTIPFICRYRSHLVGNLKPDRMREIKTSYGQITQLKTKVTTVAKTLQKENLLTEDLQETICKVKTMEELNHIYELYKPARKKSLVEKATNLGLKPIAEKILSGEVLVNFEKYVNKDEEALRTVSEVKAGVGVLVSSIIMKNAQLLDYVRERRQTARIEIQSSQAKVKASDIPSTSTDSTKYELYFNFRSLVSQIRPHQILAINRGEKNKVLTVKVNVPQKMQDDVERFIFSLYRGVTEYTERTEFLKKIISEIYSKKILPLITKEIRRELKEKAEKASIEVFANNLRQLLLTAPVKGEKILGIDPGFSHGCKMAMISEQGNVLDTQIIYPHTKKADLRDSMGAVADLLQRHGCKIIALGNGTACRETEAFLEQVKNTFRVDFTYCIVSEQGASIYSCSDKAKQEFPSLDVNLISAVSIARRLSNPLAELVKVEPKHLGVGMYQHDVSEKQLGEALEEIVVECVSFVGVDINTASEHLLQFVAGLTPARAKNIIEYRLKNGCIKSRDELRKIKLIGEKTFTQCAGFVRIEAKTVGQLIEPLDATWVHPESYHLARSIISEQELNLGEIGRFHFIEKMKSIAGNFTEMSRIAKLFGAAPECARSVCEALQRLPSTDYRDDINRRPHFKQGLTKMSDLKVGTLATGSITNVTHFGCFVDVGVEKCGLIHTKHLQGMKPGIGDCVEVTIMNIDEAQGRISLKLEKIL